MQILTFILCLALWALYANPGTFGLVVPLWVALLGSLPLLLGLLFFVVFGGIFAVIGTRSSRW